MRTNTKHIIRFLLLSAFLLAALLPRTAMASPNANGTLTKSGTRVTAAVSMPVDPSESITTVHLHIYVDLVMGKYQQEPSFELNNALMGKLIVADKERRKASTTEDDYIFDIILSGREDLFPTEDFVTIGSVVVYPDNSESDFQAEVGFTSINDQDIALENNKEDASIEYVESRGNEALLLPLSYAGEVEIAYRQGESVYPSYYPSTPEESPSPSPSPEVSPVPEEDGLKLDEHQVKGLINRTTGSKDCTLRLEALEEDMSDLTLEYESSDKSVVKVVKPGVIRYMGVGEATVTVTATSRVTGKVYVLKIQVVVKNPGKPTFTPSNRISRARRSFTVTSSTIRGADGFQVQYSLKNLKKTTKGAKKKSFAKAGKKLVRGVVKTNKSKKTYYVRVRAYQIVNGERVYGAWSGVKRIKSR